MAVITLGKAVEGFTAHSKILACTPRYAEVMMMMMSDASDLLLFQAERVLVASYVDLLRKVQLMTQTAFKDALKADPQFWQDCIEEWGQGPGYKSRIAAHNQEWFEAEARQKLEDELKALVAREWTRALENVTALLEGV